MPRNRPSQTGTGYARLAQADDSDDEEYVSASAPRRRMRSNSGVDIKAINARLERWADEIASKFKIGKGKGKADAEQRLEIHYSVFQAPDGVRPATAETLQSEGDGGRMSKREFFDEIVESVQLAIEQGIHPKMITQGSSGSYFARNSEGRTVGVFKPKDEEPYAAGNPKWNKWIHRNLFPCCFGRACLIPNLSYVSEAAAYTLDCRLQTHLVPYTDIVHLSSHVFHYDFWDRRNYYRKKKPLPAKVGSFQVFLQGFQDANIFLRNHPWPDRASGPYHSGEGSKKKTRVWSDSCTVSAGHDEDEEEQRPRSKTEPGQQKKFVWTDTLQQAFREQLEKLVILDYIMRNTDRGLDNWMIKVDWESQEVSIVSEPLQFKSHVDVDDEDETSGLAPRPIPREHSNGSPGSAIPSPYRQQQPMAASHPSSSARQPQISIGAIDNSLSWPWKHPDAWRSFPFGWLFLPVSLIGQPFSQRTRDHFLPLLTSTHWWSETQLALRRVFAQDADFQEGMFARQIAVMKGQAWNVVETLKIADHGPLELTRRARVCVWDDLVDIPVAVPMRVPSGEMRRRAEANVRGQMEEEMDISAANAAAKGNHDLIGLGSPVPGDLPNPNRFELSRGATPRASIDHEAENNGNVQSPASPSATVANGEDPFDETSNKRLQFVNATGERPGQPQRMSYNGPARAYTAPQQKRSRRNHSFSTRHGSVARVLYSGDDLEGDLGYAAAEGMEDNRRKVIVERLETVKSKNPVFTWC